MAKKSKLYSEHIPGPKKRTSIGQSVRSRPKNKHKRRSFKNIEDKEKNDEENKSS